MTSRLVSNETLMVQYLRSQKYLVEKIKLPKNIPVAICYQPYVNSCSIFSPWTAEPAIKSVLTTLKSHGVKTLVSPDR